VLNKLLNAFTNAALLYKINTLNKSKSQKQK